MFLLAVLRSALFLLVPLSFISTTYLYLYPVFHLCAFSSPDRDPHVDFVNTLRQHTLSSAYDAGKVAPFRLLALGDPQLEGESSIPDVEAAGFPNFFKFWQDALLLGDVKHSPLQRLRHSLHDLVEFYLDDIPKALKVYQKRLDHIGKDYYLGHIYRTLHWWTDPTHVTVLGDLVGSQWIDDDEFEVRGWRFWNRVFKGSERVSEDISSQSSEDFQNMRILGQDAATWKRTIINVAGNHDIGYAGDLSPERMDRFNRVFGNPNYEIRFHLPINSTLLDGEEEKTVPELRIVIMNDMNLDGPASSRELQDETYQFLNRIILSSEDVERPAHFTLVLTHIPLHKREGICVDGPFFDFFDGEFENGVKEQNHLSSDTSKGFLEGIFGMSGNPGVPGQGYGRRGVIINGHDHEGCDTYHFINQSSFPEHQWEAQSWQDAHGSGIFKEPRVPGLREITVRSMMGDFGGNAGLMSLWFDKASWDWKFEFTTCALGSQHIWWATHIVNLITIGVGLAYAVMLLVRDFPLGSILIPDQKLLATGKMRTGKLENEKSEGGDLGDFLKRNGNLDPSESGKRSLRKKKSRKALNSGPIEEPRNENTDDGHLADTFKANDNLDAESGKKSLKKKKSRKALNSIVNGGSPDGSNVYKN
jgi:hypothetical protein